MSYLSVYFLLKVGLYYSGHIGFHWVINLVLAVLAAWPLATRRQQRWRAVLIWPAALALLYHDSFLPTPARLWSQIDALKGFTVSYWLELLARLINPWALAGLLGSLAIYVLLSRRIRFPTLAFIAIASVPLVATMQADVSNSSMPNQIAATDRNAKAAPQEDLSAFYARENLRHLTFSSAGQTPPFDIIVLHICSLSWDDLDFVNESNNPLFKRFDVVFRQFNSAASYSGPASIRVLRGSCGQSRHDKLYQNTDAQCYVFPSLEKIGYQTGGLLNHDGHFDKFGETLEQRTGLKGKIETGRGTPPALQSFDGSPIYDDFAVLSRWWEKRQTLGRQPQALYYNTITLHDGNHAPGVIGRSSLESFKPRLTRLLSDFDKFLAQLEASHKPVVVLMIPEHGAALRGDKIQLAGLREIPGPGITLVPAALKVIGLKPGSATTPLLVNAPVSYFDLYSLLADMLADDPYQPGARPLAERVQKLEQTPFVSENEDVVVRRNAAGIYLLKTSDNSWVPYPVK